MRRPARPSIPCWRPARSATSSSSSSPETAAWPEASTPTCSRRRSASLIPRPASTSTWSAWAARAATTSAAAIPRSLRRMSAPRRCASPASTWAFSRCRSSATSRPSPKTSSTATPMVKSTRSTWSSTSSSRSLRSAWWSSRFCPSAPSASTSSEDSVEPSLEERERAGEAAVTSGVDLPAQDTSEIDRHAANFANSAGRLHLRAARRHIVPRSCFPSTSSRRSTAPCWSRWPPNTPPA